MKHTIIFPERMFTEMKEHLLQNEKEQLASILCGISENQNQVRFLCKELIKARPEDLEYNSTTRVRAKHEYRKRILTECLEQNLHLIDCHSHPFSKQDGDFSCIDDGNDFRTLTYISETIPGIRCGCMVVGHNGLKARTYNRENSSLVPIEEITIIGRTLQRVTQANQEADYRSFDRQILLWGKEGQRKISQTEALIVGAGGTGSMVFQMVTRLGLGSVTIIDHDTVERSNLNRLVGSTPGKINLPKVEVLKEYAETYSKTRVEAINGSILDREILERVKNRVDVIFSCTDNQSSRMISNETSVKYHIPLIDLGAGILTEKGYVEAGGQVRIVLPDGFCLACIDGINYAKAGEELLNEQDRQMRRAAGYVQGHDIPSPSVISLNGTIASLAVTEFLNLVTGIREVNTYVTYDMQSNNVIAQTLQAERDESCPVCGRSGIRAMGDLIPFPNLLEPRIPENIPETQTNPPKISG
jgi:molybdopterin/thiamine biosynthesis adenylyltransferase